LQVIFTAHLKWERGLVLNRVLSKIKEILISILDLLKKVLAWSIIVYSINPGNRMFIPS
jgi:hypothetical protein